MAARLNDEERDRPCAVCAKKPSRNLNDSRKIQTFTSEDRHVYVCMYVSDLCTIICICSALYSGRDDKSKRAARIS